jgi:hypothetical protein
MPAQSKQQQKFMGIVHAIQKGDIPASDASPEAQKVAKDMKPSDVKDFASTSHKGLPKKVKQEILNRLKEYAGKMGRDHMGGDDIPSANKGGLRDFDGYDNVDYNRDMQMDEAELKGIENIPSNKKLSQLSDSDKLKIVQGVGNLISFKVPSWSRDKKWTVISSGKIVKKKDFDGDTIFFLRGKGPIKTSPTYSSVKELLDGVEWDTMELRRESVDEGNLPTNWLQGRVSDYHTKLGTTPRDKYDDTNFKKDNSGQPDLEELAPSRVKYKVGEKVRVKDGIPGIGGKEAKIVGVDSTDKNKFKLYIKGHGNVSWYSPTELRKLGENLEENDLEDAIHQVKKFDKPKDQKLLTIKVINKLKDKRNKSNSSDNKEKLQKMIDKIEGDYKKGKFLTEASFHALNNPRMKKSLSNLVKDKKVENPETGRQVSVQTAVSNPEHPAHDKAVQIKKSLLQRLKGMVKNESINESLDVKKVHNDILKFLKTKKGVEIQDYSDFPNKYGDNVSTYQVKYDIEDKFNYKKQEIKIEYSTSRVFIPNKGYFSFKTINDIKNIIDKKSSLKESVNEGCWKGYKQVGGKMKNGRMVPNCVPESVNEELSVDEMQMVVGIIDILKQVDDKENRKRIVLNMIQKFKEEGIEFDYQKFVDALKEYSMGSYEYNENKTSQISEAMFVMMRDIAQDILPKDVFQRAVSPQGREELESIMSDLKSTLNKFFKMHKINKIVK